MDKKQAMEASTDQTDDKCEIQKFATRTGIAVIDTAQNVG